MLRNDFMGELLVNPQISLTESRPWGNLYVTGPALSLLDVQPPTHSLPKLRPGPRLDSNPPIDVTIGTFGELNPDAEFTSSAPAALLGKYDERRARSSAHIFALLNQDLTASPTDRINHLTTELPGEMERTLARLPALRVEYKIGRSYSLNVHLSGIGATGFLLMEKLMREPAPSHIVDYVGTVAIFLAGFAATIKESGHRQDALAKNVPGYEQSARKMTKSIMSDLMEAPARWAKTDTPSTK